MTATAVITGASEGIGRAVAVGIADRLGREGNVYLTDRDPERLGLVVRGLRDAGLQVLGERVDVRSTTAVNRFAALVAERHGSVDVVISSAAPRITPERPQADQAATFIETNNFGTTRMVRAFERLLAPGGRYLIVAGAFGSLRELPPKLHERFDTVGMSLDDLDCQLARCCEAFREGRASAEGWPQSIDVASGIGQVAAMRILAGRQRALAKEDGRFVAAVCPPVADIVALAFDSADRRLYGELVERRRVIPWR